MDLISLVQTSFEHGPIGAIAFIVLFGMMIWNTAVFYTTTREMRKESTARHIENVRRLEIVESDIKRLLARPSIRR